MNGKFFSIPYFFYRVHLLVLLLALIGCNSEADYLKSLPANEGTTPSISSPILPSSMVLAFDRKYSLRCPDRNSLNHLYEYINSVGDEQSLGISHVGFMVCLDLAGERQRALLEAHRVLKTAEFLASEYEEVAVIFAASFLAEVFVGTAADTAIGNQKLVDLDEAPFPHSREEIEIKKRISKKHSELYLLIFLENKG